MKNSIVKNNTLGSRLRLARENMELRASNVTGVVKCTEKTLYNWENNTSVPDAIKLNKLAILYRCDFNWLLTGKEPDESQVTYDTDEIFEMYDGLRDFLECEETHLLLQPTSREVKLLKSARFGRNFKPSKNFYRELLMGIRRGELGSRQPDTIKQIGKSA